jgi:hypothetical protein
MAIKFVEITNNNQLKKPADDGKNRGSVGKIENRVKKIDDRMMTKFAGIRSRLEMEVVGIR